MVFNMAKDIETAAQFEGKCMFEHRTVRYYLTDIKLSLNDEEINLEEIERAFSDKDGIRIIFKDRRPSIKFEPLTNIYQRKTSPMNADDEKKQLRDRLTNAINNELKPKSH